MVYVVSITGDSRETKWCLSWNLELRDRVYPRVEMDALGSECDGTGHSDSSRISPCLDFKRS